MKIDVRQSKGKIYIGKTRRRRRRRRKGMAKRRSKKVAVASATKSA